MKKQARLVLVSDVDGCLLDRQHHSHADAHEALERVKQDGVPLVLCSSKTRAELERLRDDLQITDPFIAENGGAIFVPPETFPFVPPGAARRGGYDVVELGRPHQQVLHQLVTTAARVGVEITTFSDMSVQRVAAECSLSLADARLAKLREYDEPFRLVEPDPDARAKLRRGLRSAGLRCANGGQYDHATLATDKGVATGVLRRFYLKAWGEVTLVGLGDGENDVELLRAVDLPIVVRSSDEAATAALLDQVRRARVSTLQGPAGWNESVLAVLDGVDPLEAAGAGPLIPRAFRRTGVSRTAR